MRVDLITKEYPPEVYGGAGVHVTELVNTLRHDIEVQVRAFGAPRDEAGVTSYAVPAELAEANQALQTMGVDLRIAQDVAGADIVHSHTWYANLAGRTAQLLHGIPHVMTAHSLEPLRPWKAEQLGGGYALSSWIEREAIESADAVIAVSDGMRRDILRAYPAVAAERVRTIRNGIDLDRWRRRDDPALLASHDIEVDRPTVVFVGRITRQKGLTHFLRAIPLLPVDTQVVLLAGAPDTPEIRAEFEGGIAALDGGAQRVVLIGEHLPQEQVQAVLSAADVFVCPSVYEPLGIVNLEAMACEVPVVATATGGIPEVVEDGVTGLLVPIEQAQDGTGTPTDPERFARDFAAAVSELLESPERAAAMGRAGRERAEAEFSWQKIADATRALYEELLHTP